jgi:hypothetical protein
MERATLPAKCCVFGYRIVPGRGFWSPTGLTASTEGSNGAPSHGGKATISESCGGPLLFLANEIL